MRITNKLFLSGFIHSSLLNGSLSARLNNMVKMLEVQEERFGGPKGSSRRRASLNNKQEDQESLYTETEDDGELIPYGTYSGLSKNKDIQDHLINEHAVEHAKLVAKHETKQARIAAEYVADVGILSNDVESNTVDPQDQTVLSELSQPQDVEDTRQVQAQGRRLVVSTLSPVPSAVPSKSSAPSTVAFKAFQDRCDITSSGMGYVDCVGGFVKDVNGLPTSQTCADACGLCLCCIGDRSCDSFTGKVCRDGSCGNGFACRVANIDYVVGPSCTDGASCDSATIGSVDSSCKEGGSCQAAQLSGVDLINSCNEGFSCYQANGSNEITELIDCCNEEDRQCIFEVGFDIVNAGCPNAPSEVPSSSSMPSEVPSQSSAPSSSSEPSVEPSESPSISQEPSEVPSTVPSESGKPSVVPSDSPSTSVEPSSSPTKSGKRSGKSSNFDEKSGKGKSSKIVSKNMASKSDVLAYLSSNDLSFDEKKALISMLIIEILEHLAGDMNEMD